jgi:sec-independent protein translocase protein TatB
MFDITSGKLLILAIVALIVVGPKDLPLLLRTVGKYLGIVRRHAAEFRAQLDEVMREAELQDIKKEFDNFGREMHASIEVGGAPEFKAEPAQFNVDDAAQGPTPQLGSPEQVAPEEAAPEPLASEPFSPEPLMTPIKQTGTER